MRRTIWMTVPLAAVLVLGLLSLVAGAEPAQNACKDLLKKDLPAGLERSSVNKPADTNHLKFYKVSTNVWIPADQITWTEGEGKTVTYSHPYGDNVATIAVLPDSYEYLHKERSTDPNAESGYRIGALRYGYKNKGLDDEEKFVLAMSHSWVADYTIERNMIEAGERSSRMSDKTFCRFVVPAFVPSTTPTIRRVTEPSQAPTPTSQAEQWAVPPSSVYVGSSVTTATPSATTTIVIDVTEPTTTTIDIQVTFPATTTTTHPEPTPVTSTTEPVELQKTTPPTTPSTTAPTTTTKPKRDCAAQKSKAYAEAAKRYAETGNFTQVQRDKKAADAAFEACRSG